MYILIDHRHISFSTAESLNRSELAKQIAVIPFDTKLELIEHIQSLQDMEDIPTYINSVYFVDITIPLNGRLFTILNTEGYRLHGNRSNNSLWDTSVIKALIQGETMQQLTIVFKTNKYVELNGTPIYEHIITGDRITLLRELGVLQRNIKVKDHRVDTQLQIGLTKLYASIDSGTNSGVIPNKHIEINFEIK